MRLIDADALIARLEKDAEQMEDTTAQLFTIGAINDIKREPTITTVPQRMRGRWMTKAFMTAECSVCHVQLHDMECANFCPSCGADMREGEK